MDSLASGVLRVSAPKTAGKAMAVLLDGNEAAFPGPAFAARIERPSTQPGNPPAAGTRLASVGQNAEVFAVDGVDSSAGAGAVPITGQLGIDAEHRALLCQYQALLQTMESGTNVDAFALSWYMVVRQARAHFAAEERTMRESDYDGYRDHKAEHDKLLVSAEDLLKSVTVRFDRYDCMGVARFFRRWLLNHMQTHDRRLSEHLQKHRPLAVAAVD
jgi:hemerythrin-like metal-binding protein